MVGVSKRKKQAGVKKRACERNSVQNSTARFLVAAQREASEGEEEEKKDIPPKFPPDAVMRAP